MLKISACLIAKNEEKNLPRWLACVRVLADEMVVVDTGSTDRTVNVARAAGAKVFSFAWRNDFAAAKNFALQRARGSWIVFLDADEYFSEEDIPKVRAHIRRLDRERDVAGFFCPLLNIDVDKGGVVLDGGLQIRVFRRHPDLRYRGHIHEMLNAKGAWRMVRADDVRVWHTGYSSSLLRAKAERNLALLLAERERRGEEPSDAFYLADCYFGLRQYEDAARWARQAIASGYTLVGRERRPYDVLLNSLQALRRPLGEVRAAVRDALEKFPRTADFKAVEGAAAWEEKDYLSAEASLREALAMTAAGGGHVRALTLGHLADIEHRRGRDALALDAAVESIREERFCEMALAVLCKVCRALPAVDVIQLLNTIYDAASDAHFLARALAKGGLYEVCLYYDNKAGGKALSDEERFFCAGAFPSTAREAARGMARCRAFGALAARRVGDGREASFWPEAEDGAAAAETEYMKAFYAQADRVFPRD